MARFYKSHVLKIIPSPTQRAIKTDLAKNEKNLSIVSFNAKLDPRKVQWVPSIFVVIIKSHSFLKKLNNHCLDRCKFILIN